jgi:adenosylmethionine-8-amino-7-oxononanoate aminotransferase
MAVKKIGGMPYHLWNPATPMDKFLSFLGFGPTYIVRGEGPYFYNARGKRYLNGNSATWNFGIGFGREKIIEAAASQMRALPFSSGWGLSHPKAVELAARLVEITGGRYQHVYLGANGSEMVETALKITRQYHRQSPQISDRSRYKIIALRESYHGFSYGAISAAGKPLDEEKFGPLVPGFMQIDPPYCYRCPFGKSGYPECGLACALALQEKIEAEGPETVAAFILEPVMGEYGVIAPPEPYYQLIGEICQRYGLLLIADEVTTGFGRTGQLFASQGWVPQPDILCLGKLISGGYLPLAATLTTEAIFERFLGEDKYLRHGSTNSGHPVTAAVGLAAIDIILREKLPENAARVGEHMLAGLKSLMGHHAIIGDVRGKGMMFAVELVEDRDTKQPLDPDRVFDFVLDIADRGLLISLDGLRFLPPLIIDEAVADEMVDIIDKSLAMGIGANVSRKLRMAREFMDARRG